MKYASIEEAYAHILESDPRFDVDAYVFIKDALDFTVDTFQRASTPHSPGKHVSGQELLDGMRQYAIKQFGPLTMTVLKSWGIHSTEDIGEIVFNLVEHGILGKTDDDTREDFANGYDFYDAFTKPFLPLPEPTPDVSDQPPQPRRSGSASPRKQS
jgi:uncharacterized repeat protein (TIGR04138 family)